MSNKINKKFSVKVIGDISCDIDGAIPCTKIASTIEKPFFDYCVKTKKIVTPFSNKKNITQQHGLFHGGISGAIADNAAGFAAMTLMGKEKEPLTIEFKINFLNIADGERLIAEAVILQGGRSIFHGESKVYTIKNENKILTASALVTIKATSKVSETLF